MRERTKSTIAVILILGLLLLAGWVEVEASCSTICHNGICQTHCSSQTCSTVCHQGICQTHCY